LGKPRISTISSMAFPSEALSEKKISCVKERSARKQKDFRSLRGKECCAHRGTGARRGLGTPATRVEGKPKRRESRRVKRRSNSPLGLNSKRDPTKQATRTSSYMSITQEDRERTEASGCRTIVACLKTGVFDARGRGKRKVEGSARANSGGFGEATKEPGKNQGCDEGRGQGKSGGWSPAHTIVAPAGERKKKGKRRGMGVRFPERNAQNQTEEEGAHPGTSITLRGRRRNRSRLGKVDARKWISE